MQKIYCYIDETGLDASAETFIVTVVITTNNRDELISLLETIEKKSKKGKTKWIEAKHKFRQAYITAVLELEPFHGQLHYAEYPDAQDSLALTIDATAKAILAHAEGDYKVTVFVDALPDAHINAFGAGLRKLQIRTKKIRGVRKDETDAFIRLADALCGFVRLAANDSQVKWLLQVAIEKGIIIKI